MSSDRRPADYFLVFVIGYFGLAAQTILFRRFLTVYEGNELGIAVFFCSWLLWVAVGALAARRRTRRGGILVAHVAYLPLLYAPACLAQMGLIDAARTLAGVEVHEVFPLARMLPISLLVNAPVSLCTGIFFTLACQWFTDDRPVAVARVYIAEAAGSFCGGVVVTLMLASHATAEWVFVCTAALLVGAVGLQRLSRAARLPGIALLILAVVLPALRPDRAWTRHHDLNRWRRYFSAESFVGSFTTPQARYLYGERAGQFIVLAWESPADAIPDTESASRIIAINLAQQPAARRFLVVGPGSYEICRRLLDLPRLHAVAWLGTDPAYARGLMRVLPRRLRVTDPRLSIPAADPRAFLQSTTATFDTVVLNLPDATTLSLNRYLTREFFALVKRRLARDGTVGVRIPGGDNFLGDDLVNTGASVYRTLGELFRHIAIKPGDDTWLIASDGDHLSEKPAVLRDRFRAVEGAAAIYPPEGIMTLYPPDRCQFQRAVYETAVHTVPPAMLRNTDRDPKALLYSLLFAARQTGAGVRLMSDMKRIARHGLAIALCAIGLYAVLRFLYVLRSFRPATAAQGGGTHANRPFDSYVLVFSTGIVSMSLSLLLIYRYQSAFGDIYRDIGLVSALLMLGLAGGGLLCERVLTNKPQRAAILLPAAIGDMLLLAAIAYVPVRPGHFVFGLLFLVTGLVSGTFIPIAAASLKQVGEGDRAAGGALTGGDHLGGMLGALMTGGLMIPLLGSGATLLVLAALIAANLPVLVPLARHRVRRSARSRADAWALCAGYTATGIVALALVAAVLLRRDAGESLERLMQDAVADLTRDTAFERRETVLPDGRPMAYFVAPPEGSGERAYVFRTDRLVTGVAGYGGPIVMAVMTDGHGVLRGLRILSSNETPAYLESLHAWRADLLGRRIFGDDVLAGVDAVSGATWTSKAIIETLRRAGSGFAAGVLGLGTPGAGPDAGDGRVGGVGWPSLLLVVLAGTALFLRIRRQILPRVRLAFLMVVVVVCGGLLNVQYSMANTLSLVGWRLPQAALTPAFLLVVVVPVLVLVFGNVYCGYLCPFGALQELIGWLRPAWLKTTPDRVRWRWFRRVKYAILLVFLLLYALSLAPGVVAPDPLVTVFARGRTVMHVIVAGVLLGLAFFFNRFWCRALCPAGAFLSLLNAMPLARRYLPRVRPGLCMYGVESSYDLDCIGCDRCRQARAEDAGRARAVFAASPHRVARLAHGVAVCAAAAILLGAAVHAYRRGGSGAGVRAGEGATGQMRRVDMDALNRLIRGGHLSDHEALHWNPAAGE